jgi:hypothetical protein
MAQPELDPQLSTLLKEHSSYFSLGSDGRVVCSINGHQFPPKFDVISAFVK